MVYQYFYEPFEMNRNTISFIEKFIDKCVSNRNVKWLNYIYILIIIIYI